VHPSLIEKIEHFCVDKGIDTELFEDLSGGLNHSEIGGLIAAKWNFPEALVAAIRYHHNPYEAGKEFTDVVETVYLANALVNYEEDGLGFDQIDRPILTKFKITSEAQFKQIMERLSKAFDTEAQM
jgi:HD-like signal output (HDOD) protein